MTVFFWLALSVIVGVAANTRNRNPGGWGFLAIIISPLLAGLLLLALPKLEAAPEIYLPGSTVPVEAEANPLANPGVWVACILLAILVLGAIAAMS